MTNQTTPTPFPQFQPTVFNPGAAFDFFQSDAPYTRNVPTPGRNRIQFSPVQGQPFVVRWDLYLEDLSGGLDRMQENIDSGSVSNKLADSELEHRYNRTLCLLPLEEDAVAAADRFSFSGAGADGNENNVLHVAFGQSQYAIVGGGNSATQALFLLGQSSGLIDVTPTDYDASAFGNISALAQGTINSVPNRLFVGHAANPTVVLTRDGGTTVASMHANTEPTWWIAESPLNAATPGATTLVIAANNSIYLLSSTAAVADAPTKTLDDFTNGSYLIGILELPGSPVRIYAFVPTNFSADPATSISHVLDRASGYTGEIWSINLEGDEPQILDMGIRNLLHAVKIREGIAATDGQSVIFHNGQKNNLTWHHERVRASDRQRNVSYLQAIGDRLFAAVIESDSGGQVPAWWWEEYDFERQAWYRASKAVDYSASTMPALATSGQTPLYHFGDRQEGYTLAYRLYWYVKDPSAGFHSISILPLTINPFHWQNVGEVVRQFEASGTARTPVYHFYSGFPKVVSDIWCGGDIRVPSGGAGAKVEVEVGLQAGSSMSFGSSSPTAARTATFSSADRWDKFTRKWKTGAPEFDRLQLQFWLTQATSGTGAAKTTPNALPVKVGGYIFLDGVVRNPIEIDQVRFRDE